MADLELHRQATFLFAALKRDPQFRRHFTWLRNTIVCVESDLVTEIKEQVLHYFPQGGSIACWYPDRHEFRFTTTGPEPKPNATWTSPQFKDDDSQTNRLTIGMMLDTVGANSVNLVLEHPPKNAYSTVEVERERAMALGK